MHAAILVDIQNDFLPGGALGVPHGNEVVEVANRLADASSVDVVVATGDWHPSDHGSFASQYPGKQLFDQIDLNGLPQTLWPDHCVQYTFGARLAGSLIEAHVHRLVFKGCDSKLDGYSAFFDNARRHSTGLCEWLCLRGIARLSVLGLATDFCVKATVLDALRCGFDTSVVVDGCRAVNLDPLDGSRAFDEMRAAGARLLESREVV